MDHRDVGSTFRGWYDLRLNPLRTAAGWTTFANRLESPEIGLFGLFLDSDGLDRA
jgi:hypothetical protein